MVRFFWPTLYILYLHAVLCAVKCTVLSVLLMWKCVTHCLLWIFVYVYQKWLTDWVRFNVSPNTYRVAQKWYSFFGTPYLHQTLNNFQNYFTIRIRRKCVITLSLKIPPHLKCVAILPCEMSSVLKATIENETTSVTTHFKKLKTGNNVFIVSVMPKFH